MSSKDDRVLEAKDQVMAALGDNSKDYLANMKLWFRKIWTKEQFDAECRKMFTPSQTHLHNAFFLAILNKITQPLHQNQNNNNNNTSTNSTESNLVLNPLSKDAKKRKKSSRPTAERSTFTPVDLYDFLPDENQESILRPPSTPLPQPRYAAQELFLPDTGLILGRIMVSAWENGLTNAEDNVCEMVVIAVQVSEMSLDEEIFGFLFLV